MCCLIGLDNLDFTNEFYVVLNSVLTVGFSLYLLAFPICAFVFMRLYKDKLEDYKDKYGEVWASLR